MMKNVTMFDINNIYILIHKSEKENFYYSCPSRLWDGFVVITDGECVFEDGDRRKRILKKEDTVFLRKGAKYVISSEGGCSYFTSAFDFSADSNESLSVMPKFAVLNILQFKNIRKMTEVWQRQANESYMFCKIQLLNLYYEFICERNGAVDGQNSAVDLALKYIHQNFKRNFKSVEIAEYCSLSESYLRSKFLRETGMTIWEYRDRLRITAAKELLASGLFSVKETAYELGFCDVYYFSKFFTHHTNISPAKYMHMRTKAHSSVF